jgi:hypothetical protein
MTGEAEGVMFFRFGIVATAALLLAACSSFDCGSAGDGHRAAGPCGTHTTFFRGR